MRHALLVGAFALLITGSGAIASAHTSSPNPQLDFTESLSTANAQALSPDVAEWTSHLIITGPARHRNGIGRFAGGVLARTSKIAQELTHSALHFLGVPYVFGGHEYVGIRLLGLRAARLRDARDRVAAYRRCPIRRG